MKKTLKTLTKKDKEMLRIYREMVMSDLIYDTLMNIAMSDQFNIKKVKDKEISGNKIYFKYGSEEFILTINKKDGE